MDDSCKILEEHSIIELGVAGRVDVIPKSDDVFTSSTLPCGLPPVLPSLTDELNCYLSDPQKLPNRNLNELQVFFDRKPNPLSLLKTDVCPPVSTIKVNRDLLTGEQHGYSEVSEFGSSETAKNSTSLHRAPGPLAEVTRGSSTNYPFWPGGLEEPILTDVTVNDDVQFKNLETVPPGFDCGMKFDNQYAKVDDQPALNVLNISDILNDLDGFEFDDDDDESEDDLDMGQVQHDYSDDIADDIADSDIFAMPPAPVLNISEPVVKKTEQYSEWIKVIDVHKPVPDFYRKVPNMAHKWNFELDIFQKQAIVHLENHDSVFVAAHTSAGKTVVAEYAIAMSQKHMTRTIYTSPIKALSNQKFRDFSDKFDVGLLTGDVQLKPEASCLIMTTEILQSMLYKGSDIIRDLEWVIFDEVHYINDAERGVVWEEVLIMLPRHVNIIMLSATVPNTVEFADWIGRTKKKKIYVISTMKRPVPLEHYLYTGTTGKTRNECFLLVDSQGNMLSEGYQAAMNAKKERASKKELGFGAKGPRGGSKPGQDKNVYITLIEFLKQKDLLPVVCFTLSRKRCDNNADLLSSIDFTTGVEKDEIRYFFQKSLAKLKGPDKKIPQVNKMRDLLQRGLAVHHSGILPILKEIVEMLFHKGLVKMLFATETFAMGVNMPTRTVVFDSIRKHDGMQFRDLLPGEYIQMAGRAGRRGHDTTGTVIILCKVDVPEKSDLHRMMLGKPTKLESRFRITYGMILNLLRVRQLRVEDMMRRSFDEAALQRNMASIQQKLEHKMQQLSSAPQLQCDTCSVDIKEFYSSCNLHKELLHKFWHKELIRFPNVSKTLCVGRVLLLYSQNGDKASFIFAVIVSSTSKAKQKNLIVFTVAEEETPNKPFLVTEVEERYKFLALANGKIDPISGRQSHKLVDIAYDDIVRITSKIIKADGDKVITDVMKRQLPRFKDDPPGQSTISVLQELTALIKNAANMKYLSLADAFGVKEIDLVLESQQIESLNLHLCSNFQCIQCFSFASHFEQAYEKFKNEREVDELRYQISEDSLKHLQEYKCMLLVLCELGYIDTMKTVEMKGRVACEMGNHELMITELIYNNILTRLPPEEIAALLSCLVFQQKTENEPELTPSLKEGVEKIKEVAKRIGESQKNAGLLQPVGDYVDQFKFGLTEVVYKWAKGMSFEKITELTDVQEGIIVKCIQRLDETLRDVKSAARIVGDPVLSTKMESASVCIRRDIVFAGSLYTQ